MTGTTLKDMFGRVLDTEAPPPRPVDEVITRNGRILRRRRFGGALAAALLVAAGGAGAGAGILHDPGGPAREVGGPSREATGPPWPLPQPVPQTGVSGAAPTPRAFPWQSGTPAYAPPDVKRRSGQLLRALLSVIPSGWQIASDTEVRGANGEVYPLRTVQLRAPGDPGDWKDQYAWAYLATVEVRAGGRAVVMTLEVFPRDPAMRVDPDDLCRTSLAGQVEDQCGVVGASDGTRVRMSSYDEPGLGRTYHAIRFYRTFVVRAGQGPRARPGVPGLDRPVLDKVRLANLTGHPWLTS